MYVGSMLGFVGGETRLKIGVRDVHGGTAGMASYL